MAIKEILLDNYRELRGTLGAGALHSLYPNDFEYYLCSLEITNSKGDISETLIFPVMPDSISSSKISITSVKKSAFGVNSLMNPSFVPFPISISGTFGRKMKMLLGVKDTKPFNSAFFTKKGWEFPVFSTKVKTGYGTLKLVEKIFNRACYELDELNKPYLLYFYNLSLNENYLVEAKNFKATQTRAQNMIWNYSLEMQAIAPADSIKNQLKNKSLIISMIGIGAINTVINNTMGQIRQLQINRKKKILKTIEKENVQNGFSSQKL